MDNRGYERTILELEQRLAASNDLCRRLQEALNKARGPEGETEYRVADWLRERGFTVTKNT